MKTILSYLTDVKNKKELNEGVILETYTKGLKKTLLEIKQTLENIEYMKKFSNEKNINSFVNFKSENSVEEKLSFFLDFDIEKLYGVDFKTIEIIKKNYTEDIVNIRGREVKLKTKVYTDIVNVDNFKFLISNRIKQVITTFENFKSDIKIDKNKAKINVNFNDHYINKLDKNKIESYIIRLFSYLDVKFDKININDCLQIEVDSKIIGMFEVQKNGKIIFYDI